MASDALFSAIVGGGNVGDVRRLLSEGVDPNRPFRDGMCPLNGAIAFRRLDIVRLLLASDRIDITQADSFRLDGCRRQPVHYAAAFHCDDVVDQLLSLGVDVDQADEGGSTPLHHAAASGNLNLVEDLLRRGADVNHASNSGRTASWKAAQAGHRQVVLSLISAGADINMQNQVGATVLFDCAKAGLLEILSDLLKSGISLETRDISGNTALHGCASAGQTGAARMLLHAGANVNTRNDNGSTALHNAVVYNRSVTAVCLLNHGAEIGVANIAGQTAMYMALLHKRRPIARILHAAGAMLAQRELDMYRSYEARRYEEKQDFLDWALRQFNMPSSLSSICRLVVRRSLVVKTKCMRKTGEVLPLPPAMKNYVLFCDFSSDNEESDDCSECN